MKHNPDSRWGRIAVLAGVAFCLGACGDDDGAMQPVAVELGSDRAIAACETVRIVAQIDGRPVHTDWQVIGVPLVTLREVGDGAIELTGPALAEATSLEVILHAEQADGVVVADALRVDVAAAPTPADLAAGMVSDCAPFAHGVASGDPAADGVVLWTRLDAAAAATEPRVRWQVARDPLFREVIASGEGRVEAESDFTLHPVVEGLAAGQTYYYRFQQRGGGYSALGRTRTAPATTAARARLAVASCSSIYSGYFNAYRRIAERSDLDLVVHLGDYIYDFVDENEQVRVPSLSREDPRNLAEWRAVHSYYLSDPNLRLARAMHPWVVIWDNHDVEASAAPSYNGSVQAFREWVPMRQPDPQRPEVIYRTLQYGDLFELTLLDALLYRNGERLPDSEEPSMLGAEQFAWFEGELDASRASWRLFGNQKLFGQARVNPDFVNAYDGERRDFFDLGAWDGFRAARTQLLQALAQRGFVDNLMLSGDSHISVALNLVDDFDAPQVKLGAEMLATSISRGNIDEALGELAQPRLIDFLVTDTERRNPHQVYLEVTKHGYGTLDVTHERIEATFWYSPLLAPATTEEQGPVLILRRGAGEWDRP